MKIFNQEEINGASEEYILSHYNKRKVDVYIEDAFKSGLEIAQAKIEEILVGNLTGSFNEFLLNSEKYTQKERKIILEALCEFIEKRNE